MHILITSINSKSQIEISNDTPIDSPIHGVVKCNI